MSHISQYESAFRIMKLNPKSEGFYLSRTPYVDFQGVATILKIYPFV